MAEMPIIEASARSGTGKGAARAARREGLVPGVIYGGGADPQSIAIKHNVLLKSLKAGRFLSTLLNVKVDGGDNRVICRAVQRDVVRDLPIHVDFLRLTERSRINLHIPVVFENEEDSPGLKKGGVLTVVRPEVELKVTAGAIPEQDYLGKLGTAGFSGAEIVHRDDNPEPDANCGCESQADYAVESVRIEALKPA